MLRHRRFLFSLNLIVLLILIWKNLHQKSDNFKFCLTNKFILNKEFYLNLVYIKDLNILYCDVPKAASTNLRRLLYVQLNRSQTFDNLDRKQIWIDQKTFFQKFYFIQNSSIIYQNKKNLFKFLLVRHPFRRIYSVYYDKFVNNHLEDTLSGWKQLEEDILIEMKTNENLLTIRRNDIRLDLQTFLFYIIKSIKQKRLINSHWEQIVSRCGCCFIKYDWFGKIEHFQQDQLILMKKFHQNNLDFPSKNLDKNEKNKDILNDQQLVELFRKTIENDRDFQILIDYYQLDFQLFNYDLPQL